MATAIEIVQDFGAVVTEDDLIGKMMLFHGRQSQFGIPRIVFGQKMGLEAVMPRPSPWLEA